MQNQGYYYIDDYDKEFLSLMMDIEKRYKEMNKHTRLRIESWCKKFSTNAYDPQMKKDRNLHAMCLLDMIINNQYEDPYNKFAPEGDMPVLNSTIVKSRLSTNFWRNCKQIYGAIKNNSLIVYYNDYNKSNSEEKKSNANFDESLKLCSNKNTSPIQNSNPYVIMQKAIDELVKEHKIKNQIIQSNKYDIFKLQKRQDKLNRSLERLISKHNI